MTVQTSAPKSSPGTGVDTSPGTGVEELPGTGGEIPADMASQATEAAAYLKTLAHEGRLMILCHLGTGEKSVGELEEMLSVRQAAVSQMLARLRDERLVSTRREGKTIYYSLSDDKTSQVIGLLYSLFCGQDNAT